MMFGCLNDVQTCEVIPIANQLMRTCQPLLSQRQMAGQVSASQRLGSSKAMLLAEDLVRKMHVDT